MRLDMSFPEDSQERSATRTQAVSLGSLGAALMEQGRLVEAETCYRDALKIDPRYAEALFKLGNICRQRRLPSEAEHCYRQAIEIAPDYVKAHYNLGNTLKDQVRLAEAEHHYRCALDIEPSYTPALSNLGVVLMDQGRLTEAEECFLSVIDSEPNDMVTLNNLGIVLMRQERPREAERPYREALRIDPRFAEAHNNLGVALHDQGRLAEAKASYRSALMITQDYAEALNNLGITLRMQGRHSESEASYRRAAIVRPDYIQAYYNLGILLIDQGRLREAEAVYLRALQVEPNNVQTLNNLGGVLADQGRSLEAADAFRHALQLKPDYADAHSNLLFAMNYSTEAGLPSLLEEAKRYGQTVDKMARARYSTWSCSTQPERLRVGLVSADLRRHPVGYFLENLLVHIDKSKVELLAYSNHREEDEVTLRLRAEFAAWRPVADLGDEAAARLIHDDGLHILIDLSGHTTANRLPVFAWKPAPIQVSWLGYFSTTGVAEIDYLLATEVEIPAARRNGFTETIWYLPETRLCFTAPAVDVTIAALPALNNGAVTFGCFQNLSKINDRVLGAWGTILAHVPHARLRLQHFQLDSPAARTELSRRLELHHIDTGRVALHGGVSREDYLAAHNAVDLILDTFPYPGGTTTCEALWMGVPTLTLAGDSMMERQGAGLLTAAQLPDWIATSEADYIAKATAFARDVEKLAVLRSSLRQQVLQSPLFDAPRFARHFEDAVWKMWQRYSSGGGPESIR